MFKKKLLLIFIFIFFSCNDYVKLELPKKNPTSYIFITNIDTVRTVMENRFKNKKFENLKYYTVGHNYASEIRKYLKDYNDYDGILYTFEKIKSSIYFNKNGPLDYYAHFHIHLKKIDGSMVEITINTFNSYVIIGETWFSPFLRIFGHAFFNNKNVEPSTIEEYKILLEIGDGLGVKDQMPKLILPNHK